MSATANLFVPECFSPQPAVFWDEARQNHFSEPAQPDPNWESIISLYEPKLNAANGIVFHFGAGSGEMMETLRQHGFAVAGCESSARRTEQARQAYSFEAHTLHCCSAESFLCWTHRIGQKAQAIFFRHDLEHCFELHALLRQMADVLCEDGLLIALLPPPNSDHSREAHLSFLNELAVGCASCNGNFEVAGVDCDYENRFMAFVLKKTSTSSRVSTAITHE